MDKLKEETKVSREEYHDSVLETLNDKSEMKAIMVDILGDLDYEDWDSDNDDIVESVLPDWQIYDDAVVKNIKGRGFPVFDDVVSAVLKSPDLPEGVTEENLRDFMNEEAFDQLFWDNAQFQVENAPYDIAVRGRSGGYWGIKFDLDYFSVDPVEAEKEIEKIIQDFTNLFDESDTDYLYPQMEYATVRELISEYLIDNWEPKWILSSDGKDIFEELDAWIEGTIKDSENPEYWAENWIANQWWYEPEEMDESKEKRMDKKSERYDDYEELEAYNMDKIELLVDGHAGIYVPKEFAEGYDMREWHVDKDDADILLSGPDHELYWEVWDEVLSSAWAKGRHGNEWTLYQDQDLWMVREDFNWDMFEGYDKDKKNKKKKKKSERYDDDYDEYSHEEKMELLLSDTRGIYIPQNFAEEFNMKDWGVSRQQEAILLAGPDHEWYWETWDEVLSEAKIRYEGHEWTLYQSGDLWMIRDDFTDEEWERVFEACGEYHGDKKKKKKKKKEAVMNVETRDALLPYYGNDLMRAVGKDYKRAQALTDDFNMVVAEYNGDVSAAAKEYARRIGSNIDSYIDALMAMAGRRESKARKKEAVMLDADMRAKILAAWFVDQGEAEEDEIDPEVDIEPLYSVRDPKEFSTPFGDYMILTDEEADELVLEEFKSYEDDMGIGMFTPHFQEWIMDNAMTGLGWFDDAMRESYEFYVEDIKNEPGYGVDDDGNEYNNRLEQEMAEAGVEDEDEYIEELMSGYEDGREWYKDNFGTEEFHKAVVEYGRVDWEAVAEEAVSLDGRGHFLGRYDGEENEFDYERDTYYIYRT